MNKWWTIGLVLALVAGVGLMTGCENPFDDDDDDVAAGTVTIQGNVSDFGLTSTTVAGVKAGVTVELKGTSYKTTTADDGTFVISGVPAGNYTLVIKVGDQSVEYPLGDVADNSRVEVTNITVSSTGSITVETVTVVDLGTGTSSKTVDDGDEEESAVSAGSLRVEVNRGT